MRLFIWENDGISAGYHDDGTLVVLAETVEQAREIAVASAPPPDEYGYVETYDLPGNIWKDGNKKGYFDDSVPIDAIQRAPDRVVDLDTPCVVAFNGGGYD